MHPNAKRTRNTHTRHTPRLVALLLVGLVGAGATPLAASTDTPTQALHGTDCFESHGYFRADPDDFEPALPEGFSLVTDENGDGTIVALTRVCAFTGNHESSLLAVVLVHAPVHLARADADHAILLTPSMATTGTFLDALRSWSVVDVAPRAMSVSTHTLDGEPGIAESRTRGEPDFLLAIQGTGDTAELPHGTLRTFQLDLASGAITAAFDSERRAVVALGGPASAHFVSQGPLDAPDHRLGSGAIDVGDGFAIRYRPVTLDG